MTPRQLSSLLTVHARVNDPDGAKPARKAGSVADLDRLAALG